MLIVSGSAVLTFGLYGETMDFKLNCLKYFEMVGDKDA